MGGANILSGAGVAYRELGPGDAGMLLRVGDDVFDEPIDADRVGAYLAAPGHRMIVAMAGDRVVGQIAAVVHQHPDKAPVLYIDELSVAPSHRRRGIATALLTRMIELGGRLGCEEAWLGTEIDNQAARALYERFARQIDPILMVTFEIARR